MRFVITIFLSLALLTQIPLASTLNAGHAQISSGRCSSAAAGAAADALAKQFDDHQFVFIGSTHGDLKIEQFIACLVTRQAFRERVTDIVTEWASAGQQRLIDRYILGLEEISMDDLTPIWFNTDAPTMWTTLPQVRETLKALHDVNKTLPPAKRIRLVGGNDPTDWSKVKITEDLAPYPFKTNFMPHLIIEHLAKTPGNRTLVVYGDAHIHYKGNNFMPDLEYALGRSKLFVVGRIGELRPDERNYLAMVGDPNQTFFVNARGFPIDMPWPKSLRVAYEETSKNLADYIDAFVYLGPEPDKDMTGSIPLTAAQQRELARRTSITSDPQRSMRARFQGRPQWFSAHPNDIPPRPQF
jgi:hypothetical protein